MRRSLSEVGERPAKRRCRGTIVALLIWGTSATIALRPGRAAGQDTELANECCLTLLRPTGARAVGLGGALGARPSADGVFVNPGLLGPLEADQFLIYNASTSLEDSNTFSLIFATGVGTFGLSYRHNDFGESDVTIDPDAPPTGTIAVLEHVLIATYATHLAGGLSAGLSYTLFQFRQDCRGACQDFAFTATTHLLDVGAHLEPPAVQGLRLGASLTSLGFPLQVVNEEQASPPPTRLRVAAAYEVLQHTRIDSIAEVWLSLDVVERVRSPGSPIVNMGAELALDQTLFVWAGYGGGTGTAGGAGIGVGLRYDRFDIGVAKSFVSSEFDESDPFQITFGVRF